MVLTYVKQGECALFAARISKGARCEASTSRSEQSGTIQRLLRSVLT